MTTAPNPLLTLLRDPSQSAHLTESGWDRLIPVARRTGLLARIGYLMEDAGTWPAIPERVRDNIRGAQAYIDFLQLQIRREIRLVVEAVAETGAPLLLLKGASYIASGLPNSRGRPLSDLDLLVPRDRLEEVENALHSKGWESDTTDEYDQHYYREWMHEIPPLKHRDRAVEVDVHHNLLPLTGCYPVDADELWREAVPLDETGLYTLAPADRVLHSAAHLFVSDELRGGLRDLVDIHEMCSHFTRQDPDFLSGLLQRSHRLGLSRPLYYALRSAHHLLGMRLPPPLLDRDAFDVPSLPVEHLMIRLIDEVLEPRDRERPRAALAQWLLYVRSHWLRMPPRLLFAHLAHKALMTPYQKWKRERAQTRGGVAPPRR